MAASKTTEKTTAQAPEKLIPIFLPLLEDDGGLGEVSQRETIIINGVNKILPRGEHIEVTLAEYIVLRDSGKFPKL